MSEIRRSLLPLASIIQSSFRPLRPVLKRIFFPSGDHEGSSLFRCVGSSVSWVLPQKMHWYSRHIFPWVLDHVMRRAPLAEQRPGVLAEVAGEVLEIGFGTGLNLPHYPPHVRRLAVIEPNASMSPRARKRAAARAMEVRTIDLLGGRDFAIPPESFDTVVSTWTLCTIPDAAHALREVSRVLRPGGKFIFIEHGLSPDPPVARWQHRLNPINRRLGDGCNLNRDIPALLAGSPLAVERCDRFYLRDTPRIGGYTFRGWGRRR